MTTFMLDKLESRIDNTLELSSVCRGEWCRTLETDVDLLEGMVDRAPEWRRPLLTVHGSS